MRAAILSIGSELLLGDLTDTNATWLSQQFALLGVDVGHHLSVGDDLDEIVDALALLAARADVVVCGGGLGPTQDDLTREAIAEAAGVELRTDPELEEGLVQYFASRGVRMPARNLKQARLPAGARALQPVGTAPGIAFDTSIGGHDVTIYALPGVPWELEQLFARDVFPEVQQRAGARVTVTRIVHLAGSSESAVAEALAPVVERCESSGEATISFLAHKNEIAARVTVTADSLEAAQLASQPIVDEVVRTMGPVVAGVDEDSLEQVLVRLLTEAGETVATAESATAGDIASRLASVPGASAVLAGATVVYATPTKARLLGVPQGLLDQEGPVSSAVTSEMATRVRDVVGADWGIAVTGVAGPAEQDGIEVGTVFWALAGPDGDVEVHGRNLPGDRETIRTRLGSVALELLRRRLVERATER